MKQFINLLKISLNVNFGISALRYRFTKERKRLWEPVLIFLSIIVGGGSYNRFLYHDPSKRVHGRFGSQQP